MVDRPEYQIMKTVLAFIIAVAIGITAPRLASADGSPVGGGGLPSAESSGPGSGLGTGGCTAGPEPTSGPPSSVVTSCTGNGTACPPLDPPPTTWRKYCCYNNDNNQATYRWYRWRCCCTTSSCTWKLAYKITMDLGSCQGF